MSKKIILKNTTVSEIGFKEYSLFIPANGQIEITISEYLNLANIESINEIAPYIANGTIVVNNGYIDLTKEAGLNHIKATYKTSLERNFYVSSNGDDTLADGSLSNPFATINACITYINANYTLSASNNAVIRVAAGEYISDTIVLPAFCSIWGHHYRTRISASSGDIDLIQSAGSHTIKGLLLTGVTDPDNYLIRISTTSAKRVTLQDLSLSTYEASGFVSNGIYITSTVATTTVRVKQLDFNDITGNIIYLDQNVKVAVRGAQIFECPTATFLNANNNSAYSVFNVDIDNVAIGVIHNNTEPSESNNVNLIGATIPLRKLNNYPLVAQSNTISSTTAQISTLEGVVGYWNDIVEGDTSFRVANELAVGTSNEGKESVFGEGDSYTIGMNVYTSDGTDTLTTEGTLTDVTVKASSKDTDYFGFQSNTANHCIYVCSDVQNAAFGLVDFARIMGLKIDQITACVESIEKSIVIESWNGSSWVEGSTFANQASRFYRYGNDLFIRANNSEHIRFGLSLIRDNNVKKTIIGKERYWIRLRIKNNLTIAPTFNKFKISNNRTEINADGTITMHGLARYTVAVNFQSNTFGETGGVTNSNIPIGTGSDWPHDHWIHSMKSNQLNGQNDAIYANTIIPEGCCTACPFNLKVKYIVLNEGASTNGEIKVSAFPAQGLGIPIANRNGAIEPINRTDALTASLTTGVAQVNTIPINLQITNKVETADTATFDVSNYYEGDLIFIRIGLNDNGSGNKKISIVGVDVEYVKWTLGIRI